MHPVHVTLLLAALAAGPAHAGDPIATLEEQQTALFDAVAPSVVRISAGNRIGAGFAVAPRLVVTNAHVVGDGRALAVATLDGRSLRAEVVSRAPGGLDLALLRVEADLPVLPLARNSVVRPGTFVATVGHPDGTAWTFATGMVSAAGGPDDRVMKLQLPVRAGASGGPVVDRFGRVIGVVTLGAPDGPAFAIKVSAVGALLSTAEASARR